MNRNYERGGFRQKFEEQYNLSSINYSSVNNSIVAYLVPSNAPDGEGQLRTQLVIN